MPRTRTTIALYLILVFASGILVGIVSNRLYATNTASANNATQNVGEFRKRYLAGMREQVGASEAQIVEVTRILDDTRKKLDELDLGQKPLRDKIQQQHVDQIRNLLSDPQKIAYDKWRAERARAKLLASQNQKK
jgi:hypothetical protein